MNICHFVSRADSLTYTIAKALSAGGHDVNLWVADSEYNKSHSVEIMRRLLRIPGVSVTSEFGAATKPDRVERLILQMFPRPNRFTSFELFDPLAMHANRITLITGGDRNRHWRTAIQRQWQEIYLLRRWLRKIDGVVYKNGFYAFDLFAPIKCRRVLGFDVHSMFLDDENLLEYIQRPDWKVDANRPNLINFIGSQDPASRKQILDSIRPLFNKLTPAPKTTVWHEYSDAEPAALGPMEFVDVLSSSDFTLCPPGFSLATHRVVEALLRGSIPILNANELDIYDIGLSDGLNCIAASPGHWRSAIERCFNMDGSAIIAMRNNIRSLAENLLPYTTSSKQMRFRLGPDI